MTQDHTSKSEVEEQQVEESLPENGHKTEADVESTTAVIEGEIVAEELEEEELPEPEEEEIDELTALSQQLEAVQAQADEYLDDLRRERAAFQNYKKRQENERAELRQMAQANVLLQILPVLDDMERALETIPSDQADQPWVEGILLIQRKLQMVLENMCVVSIEVEPGQPFDPFIHEAVTYEENEGYDEGQIIAVVQKGYKLGQRILRPVTVRVAK